MRTLIKATLVLFLTLGISPSASAQPESLDALLNEEASVGGLDSEVDAAPAQAEAIAAGEETNLSEPRAQQIEEIVVSARKRNELLEETPVSVTALDANSLAEAGITDLRNIRDLVPNMQFAASAVSTPLSSNIRLRGIGTAGVGTSFDPGVGVYVDGMYMTRTLSSIVDLVDVAQIEVLRGPQGTLFGKNTVGGALNITSVKPSPDLEGFASVRFANFGAIDTRASINVPITDWLRTRATFVSKNSDGWVSNTYLKEKLFNTNSIGFLGSVQILPTDDITIDLMGNYGNSHQRGQASRCIMQPGAEPAFGPSLIPDLPAACAELTPRVSTADVNQIYSGEDYGVWGSANWDIGPVGLLDELSFTVKGSWRSGGFSTRQDLDGTYLPVIAVILAESDKYVAAPTEGTTYVAEAQSNFSAWDERINGVVGVFWFNERSKLPTNIVADVNIFTQQTLTIANVDNTDIAGFGQVSIDLTEWLEFTAGLRWTQENKESDVYRNQNRSGDILVDGSTQASEKFKKWTPMASIKATMPEDLLAGTAVDHLMAYFTFAEGFRGGGFNSTANGPLELTAFNPETLDSFEVGAKAGFFDRRLEVNLSAFLYKYEDLQVLAVEGSCTDPDDPTTCQTTQVIKNAASATGRGLELELRGRPFGPFFVTGSLGLLDTVYDSFTDAPPALSVGDPGETVDISGESFNNAPRAQAHISIMAPLPLDVFEQQWLNGYITPRVDWYYQSAVHFDAEAVTEAVQPGYSLLHARLSYDFMDDRAQIALFGNNLTDVSFMNYAQNLVPYFGFVSAVYGQPRTFGGEISYRFN